MIAQLISFLRSNPDQVQPFSEKVGINFAHINDVLKEEDKFSFNDLKQLSDKLKISINQLLSNKTNEINFQFRSNAVNINQVIIEERVNNIIDTIHPIVTEYGRLSSIANRDEFVFPDDPYVAADIVRAALLDEDASRPILDLAQLLCERLNIYLIINGIGADGVSAFIDGYAYIIVSPRFGARMLFTLAHELGHLVLQHHQNALQIDFGGINTFRKKNIPDYERYANAFASQLLMPKHELGKALIKFKRNNNIPFDYVGDIDIIFLAYYFGTSFEVAAMRCEQLNLIEKGGARSLYEKVVKEYKSPEKRGKDVGLERVIESIFPNVASPNLLRCMFNAIENGDISASKVATLFGINIQQLFTFHSAVGQ
ncbi:MAG: ImmA/IrrE family metallo-endopeptidase [Hymenobacter sp.]|nr:MAG: ImmA/IrrE family metallo-endopeptidase [Hymenobacter sp.]